MSDGDGEGGDLKAMPGYFCPYIEVTSKYE
jgi:hypothetical protein